MVKRPSLPNMICSLQVLAALAVVLMPTVLSAGNNKDVDRPTGTSSFDLEHDDILPQKLKPKVNTPKGEVEVEPQHVDEVNEMISRYLMTFEAKKKELDDPNQLNNMEVIKLLIVHSWITTLKPDPNLVTMEEIGLVPLSKAIEEKLKLDNLRSPVVDAIIAYTEETEPKMSETFQKKRKHLENFEGIYKRHIKKASDDKNDIDVSHLKLSWKEVLYTLNQINENLIAHKMAQKMYIQSYILNFLPEKRRSVEKITLISTDQKKSKKFRVPSLSGMDMFSHLLLGKDHEMDKIILNGRISKYMEYFEQEKKAVTNTDLNKSMNEIKLLIVQGWIKELNPPSQFLLPEHRTKDENSIKQDLLHLNVDHPVSNAILIYSKEKEQSIKSSLEQKKNKLLKRYEEIKVQILDLPSNQQSEEMDGIEKQVNDIQDLLVAHRIAKFFYLYSFRDDFAADKKTKTLVVTSSKGETKSFQISDTPIKLTGFYEKPIFD